MDQKDFLQVFKIQSSLDEKKTWHLVLTDDRRKNIRVSTMYEENSNVNDVMDHYARCSMMSEKHSQTSL